MSELQKSSEGFIRYKPDPHNPESTNYTPVLQPSPNLMPYDGIGSRLKGSTFTELKPHTIDTYAGLAVRLGAPPDTTPKQVRRGLVLPRLWLAQPLEKEFPTADGRDEFIKVIHDKGGEVCFIPMDNNPGGHKPVIVQNSSEIPEMPVRIMERAASSNRIAFRFTTEGGISESDISFEWGPIGVEACEVFEQRNADNEHVKTKHELKTVKTGPTRLARELAAKGLRVDSETILDSLQRATEFSQQHGLGIIGLEGYIDPLGHVIFVDIDIPKLDKPLYGAVAKAKQDARKQK